MPKEHTSLPIRWAPSWCRTYCLAFRSALRRSGAAAPVSYSDEAVQLAEQEATERERDGISRTSLQRLTPRGAPPLSDEEFKRLSAAALADPTQDRFALAAQIRARRELVLDPRGVATVSVPVLGIVGSADPLGRRLLEDFVKIKPETKLVVIDGATHVVSTGPRDAAAYNHPQFVSALRAFLSTNIQREELTRPPFWADLLPLIDAPLFHKQLIPEHLRG